MKYTAAQMRAAIQKERERNTPTDAYRDAKILADMLEQTLGPDTAEVKPGNNTRHG